MQKYANYEPSKADWIDSIPAHWQTRRLSSIFSENTQINAGFEVYNALQFKYGNIIPKIKYELTDDLIATYSKYTIVQSDDIIINGLNLNYDFVTQRVAQVCQNGIITSAYISIRPHSDINSKYYAYYLKALDSIKAFNGMGTGIRLTLSFGILKTLLLPVPPKDEQDQIVRFLDWKVSSINKLINIKRKEIKLLEEQEKSLISHATHYGIHKNVSFKKTSFAWIEELPTHWHLRSFLKIAKICTNLVSPIGHLDNLHISPASIEKNTGRIIKVQKVREAGVISNNHMFFKGQLLYSKVRPLLNKVVIAPFNGLCSADMYPIETILDTRYLKYYMLSQNFLCQIFMSGNRVKMPKLNQEELSTVMVAFPNKEEQCEIADYLDINCDKINSLKQNINNYVDLLLELKNKLIADTVTGKIDVRNVSIPDYEIVNEDTADDTADSEDGSEGSEE